jgi:Bifunctional DNA primase/polymerase, N-terminal
VTVLEDARDYCRRGWAPIPVPFRSKGPVLEGWEHLRLDDERALTAYFNGGAQNVGVLLGEPSGGLVDVDLDCPEALRLAPVFLPPTRSRFGRASRRASHWLYVVTTPARTEKFADPDGADERKNMLVELRSTGVQTVFPGSVHEEGESIEWDEDGEQARGDWATLRRAVVDLAVACLLARHWPALGRRHEVALAMAGLCVRGGVDEP